MKPSLLSFGPLLVLSLVPSALAGCAPAAEPDTDQVAADITRGSSDETSARPVGYLAKEIEGGIEVGCTAVLIGPTRAITLARCVQALAAHPHGGPLEGDAIRDLRVGFGQVRGNEPRDRSSLRGVRRVHAMQGFADRYAHEVALLELEKPGPDAREIPFARIDAARDGAQVRVVTYDDARSFRGRGVGHKTQRTTRLVTASLARVEGYARFTASLDGATAGFCDADIGAAVVATEEGGSDPAATVFHGFLVERDASVPDCTPGHPALFARADGALAAFVANTWVEEGHACGATGGHAICGHELECRDDVCVTR